MLVVTVVITNSVDDGFIDFFVWLFIIWGAAANSWLSRSWRDTPHDRRTIQYRAYDEYRKTAEW